MNELIKERELDNARNPFADFDIPKYGEDATERNSLTEEQIARIRQYLQKTETNTADIMGMLLDTGARVAEIAGLWCEDVVLNTEVPNTIIHDNPLRMLKTKASRRKVPLVGSALFAVRRALGAAEGEYLFSRYTAANRVKNDAAFSALKKVLKGIDCETAHCMRHTMATRLRSSDVPEPRKNEIQGWSCSSIADQYGKQTALRNLEKDWKKTL